MEKHVRVKTVLVDILYWFGYMSVCILRRFKIKRLFRARILGTHTTRSQSQCAYPSICVHMNTLKCISVC